MSLPSCRAVFQESWAISTLAPTGRAANRGEVEGRSVDEGLLSRDMDSRRPLCLAKDEGLCGVSESYGALFR